MRRSKLILFLTIAVFCLTFILSQTSYTNAAIEKTITITDSFNSAQIRSDLWEVSSAEDARIKDYGGAIQIVKGDFATSIGWKGLRTETDQNGVGAGLTSDYILEFTLSRNMLESDWVALYIGNDGIAKRFSALQDVEGQRGSILVFNNSSIIHYIGMGLKATDNENVVALGNSEARANATSSFSLPADKQLKNDGTRYCLKFVTHFGEDANTKRYNNSLDVYITEEPENRDGNTVIDYGQKVATIYYVNVEGYFGFGSSSSGVAEISDIKVTDSATNTVIYTPANALKEPTIEHIVTRGSSEYKNYEFRVWNTVSGEYAKNYFNGPLGSLEMENGSFVKSKVIVEPDDKLYSQYDIGFKIKNLNIGENGLGIILGGQDSTYSLLTLEKVEDEYVFSMNDQDATVSLTKDNNILIKIKEDGKVLLYIDNILIETFDGLENIGGIVGFILEDDENSAEIDDYSVIEYRMVNSLSGSQSIDFTLKDKNGAPYLDKDIWYLGGNAMKLKGFDEIAFINASSSSMFGTKQKYADFVLKFDLIDITQQDPNNIFIISFGKDEYYSDYKVSPSLLFIARGYQDGKAGYMNIEAQNTQPFSNNSSSIRMDNNIFADLEEGTHSYVNFMLIAVNNTLSVYYKYDDQPDSVLAYPRAVINNIDTNGYITLTCAGKSNFSVKNFSIINISADRNFIGQNNKGTQTTGDISIFE